MPLFYLADSDERFTYPTQGGFECSVRDTSADCIASNCKFRLRNPLL